MQTVLAAHISVNDDEVEPAMLLACVPSARGAVWVPGLQGKLVVRLRIHFWLYRHQSTPQEKCWAEFPVVVGGSPLLVVVPISLPGRLMKKHQDVLMALTPNGLKAVFTHQASFTFRGVDSLLGPLSSFSLGKTNFTPSKYTQRHENKTIR